MTTTTEPRPIECEHEWPVLSPCPECGVDAVEAAAAPLPLDVETLTKAIAAASLANTDGSWTPPPHFYDDFTFRVAAEYARLSVSTGRPAEPPWEAIWELTGMACYETTPGRYSCRTCDAIEESGREDAHDPGCEATIVREWLRASTGRPTEPCSGCGGTRWSEDENWSPAYPESWDGSRSPGDGLIPCGFCNEGGWNVPVGASTGRSTATEARDMEAVAEALHEVECQQNGHRVGRGAAPVSPSLHHWCKYRRADRHPCSPDNSPWHEKAEAFIAALNSPRAANAHATATRITAIFDEEARSGATTGEEQP
jgi:hypothetical protein